MISKRRHAEDEYDRRNDRVQKALDKGFHPVFGLLKKRSVRRDLRLSHALEWRWRFGRSYHEYLTKQFEIKTGWIVIPGLPTSRSK